jgi:hypothetical protein
VWVGMALLRVAGVGKAWDREREGVGMDDGIWNGLMSVGLDERVDVGK